ncbi:MAG TPA: hypothetical protein VFE54_03110 [Mucilaginibacter sp.]|jgi:hypothetical protein|nr:hypothetical protein [Mucilaginibacter sp.]
MASFTTRIELVNPDSNDYELLHQEMRDREFYRVISFCGKWHDLPPGEYDRSSTAQMGQIYSDAGAAAQAVIDNKPLNDQNQPKNYFFIITEAVDRSMILPQTTDPLKLPPGASL